LDGHIFRRLLPANLHLEIEKQTKNF